jgi:sporadic carbohydrate cluster protein (TIGR04323 family)
VKKIQGYISSRVENKSFTPQRIQNMVIREYCRKIDAEFILSATEYYMDQSFLMLEALRKNNSSIDGVALYSLSLLPHDYQHAKEILEDLYEQGKVVHFALEELAIHNSKDIELILDINLLFNLQKQRLDKNLQKVVQWEN